MRLHDVVRDGEAKAEAGDLILDRRAAIKALKQTALFLFRNSLPPIGDFEVDGDADAAVGHAHRDGRARRGILEGVVEHLLEGQLQQPAIERELRQRSLGVNLHGPVVDLGVKRCQHVLHEFLGVGQLAPHLDVVGLQARHVHRVVNQRLQVPRLLVGHFEQFGAALDGLIGRRQQRRGGGADGSERRLEFVRHGVDERGAKLLAAARGLHLMGQVLRAGALQSDGDEITDALQNRVLHERALDGKTGDGFRTQADRGDHALVLGIEEGCALGGGVAQLILHAVEVRRAGAVDLAGAPVIEHGGAQSENFRQLARKLFGDRLHGIDEQDGAAEGVQALDVALAIHRVQGLLLHARREPAGDERGGEKAEERDPVLRIGDGELSDGRQKEEIEGERGGDGSKRGFGQAPGAGDQQHQQQISETNRGGIVRNYANTR